MLIKELIRKKAVNTYYAIQICVPNRWYHCALSELRYVAQRYISSVRYTNMIGIEYMYVI